MDLLVQETDDCDIQEQILVSESVFDQTLVKESAVDQTLVTKSAVDQALVTESALDGKQTDFDETLTNNVELEDGCEPGSDDTSSGSSFKSTGLAIEDILAEDQSDSGMYQDAQSLVVADDEDWDQLVPDPPKTWENPRDPMHFSWSSPMRGVDNNKEDYSSSVFGSDLVDVTPAMVGAGLSNLGNTCFLNAILQCFTHTVPLIESLRSHNHPKPCESETEGFCVFCALHNHIELAITSKGKSLSPLKIVENLNQLSSDFRRYHQEDAHELLQSLLDKLDWCCNDSKTNDSDKSLVQRLFGGRLVSKLKCCNCGHCSDTFEPLIDLSLEIEDASCLPSALTSFTKVETIEDEEPQFECQKCKEKVAVEKQLMVDHAPFIATFHLKRFKNDGSRVEKIDKHVEFPLELDLKPYTSGAENDHVDLNYSLYAVVVHSGFSPTSGHYFCFVRSAPDAWFRLDDNRVTRVSESHVLSRDAYILLYAKNGIPWFSTFMETEKLIMDCNASTTSPKSVLENAKQSTESSPIMKTNIISEVNEEDRSEAMAGKEVFGSAKSDYKIGKLFPSKIGGENSVIPSTSFKSVFDPDKMLESSPTNVNDEDERDIMEFSCSALDDCDHESRVNKAKDGSVIQTSLPTPTNQKDDECMRKANLASSISRRSSSFIGIPKLSFDNYTSGDRDDGAKGDTKAEKGPFSSAIRGEVGICADVNSSTFSAKSEKNHLKTEKALPCKRQLSNDRERKEACRLVKGMAGSKRRSQLMAIVNTSPEICLSNKKKKIIEKAGPSNVLRNSNLTSLRHPVAPGRLR